MDPVFSIARASPLRGMISLTPMIDVLLILLVFFMVTSTYLDLDMIAVRQEDSGEPKVATAPAIALGAPAVLLLRVGADGRPTLAGRTLDRDALVATLGEVAETGRHVMILPSASASVQALVSILDAAAEANVASLHVVRLDASP